MNVSKTDELDFLDSLDYLFNGLECNIFQFYESYNELNKYLIDNKHMLRQNSIEFSLQEKISMHLFTTAKLIYEIKEEHENINNQKEQLKERGDN